MKKKNKMKEEKSFDENPRLNSRRNEVDGEKKQKGRLKRRKEKKKIRNILNSLFLLFFVPPLKLKRRMITSGI